MKFKTIERGFRILIGSLIGVILILNHESLNLVEFTVVAAFTALIFIEARIIRLEQKLGQRLK